MSSTGLSIKIEEGLGSNRRLAAFYDFVYSSNEVDVLGGDSEFTGVILNDSLCNNSSLHTGYVLGSYGSLESTSSNELASLLSNGNLDLRSGNFIVPSEGLSFSDVSIIVDFEFSEGISDGVIIGCFDKGIETNAGFNLTGVTSEGFNVGVTERGHLFCQTFGSNGDSIEVMYDTELSKRNLISVSVYDSALQVSSFDYLNDLVSSIDVSIENEYVDGSGSLIFGGSNLYHRSSSETEGTFNGTLNNVVILSGFVDGSVLKDIGEGLLSNYSYTAPVETQHQRVTGYSETITYKTGIIGYDYNVTGTLSIITGREYITGSFASSSAELKEEGERYYKYYTLNNGSSETFYKEELGKLHSNSGYVYYPTGEGAYDTLGLNDISESIQTYTETSGIEQDKINIDLYGKTLQTGVLSEISGVVTTPLQETFSTFTEAVSGLSLTEESALFKKDFIYYLGVRP
jgi:hypothetical protein